MDHNVLQQYHTFLKNISKSIQPNINKGKALPVGTIRNWNGKLHKKQVDGSWKFIRYADEQKQEKELEGYDGRPEKLKEIENSIKNKKNESFYAITEYGVQLYQKEGNEKSVNVNAEEGALNGAIITHNHPTLMNKPDKVNNTVSFSKTDILSACKYNVKEIRAVGPDGYIYSLKPNNFEKWGQREGLEILNANYKKAEARIRQKYEEKITDKVDAFGKDSEQANNMIVKANTNGANDVMEIIANELELEYNIYKNKKEY